MTGISAVLILRARSLPHAGSRAFSLSEGAAVPVLKLLQLLPSLKHSQRVDCRDLQGYSD